MDCLYAKCEYTWHLFCTVACLLRPTFWWPAIFQSPFEQALSIYFSFDWGAPTVQWVVLCVMVYLLTDIFLQSVYQSTCILYRHIERVISLCSFNFVSLICGLCVCVCVCQCRCEAQHFVRLYEFIFSFPLSTCVCVAPTVYSHRTTPSPLTGSRFDLIDGHCDGQNGLHTHLCPST